MGKQSYIGAQLAEHLRLVSRHRAGGEDADHLIAHLPAMAIGAVQNVFAPTFGQARDVGQGVNEASGDQQPAGRRTPSIGQRHLKATFQRSLRPRHLAGHDIRAISSNLRSAALEEVPWRHAFTSQQAVDRMGWGVARLPSIDDGDGAARPAQHQRSAQSGGAAANHHDVVRRLQFVSYLHVWQSSKPDTQVDNYRC